MDVRSETEPLLASHLALHQPFHATGGFCGIRRSWGRKTTNIWCLEPRLRKKDFTVALHHRCVEFVNSGIQWKKDIDFAPYYPLQALFPLADVQSYPDWVYAICILISLLPVVSIPLVALYKFTGFLKKYITNRHDQNPYASELWMTMRSHLMSSVVCTTSGTCEIMSFNNFLLSIFTGKQKAFTDYLHIVLCPLYIMVLQASKYITV